MVSSPTLYYRECFLPSKREGRAYTLPRVFELNPYLTSIKYPEFGPLNFPNFVRKCHFRHNRQQHKRRNFSCFLYLSVLVKDRHLCLLKEATVSHYNIFLLTEFKVYAMQMSCILQFTKHLYLFQNLSREQSLTRQLLRNVVTDQETLDSSFRIQDILQSVKEFKNVMETEENKIGLLVLCIGTVSAEMQGRHKHLIPSV